MQPIAMVACVHHLADLQDSSQVVHDLRQTPAAAATGTNVDLAVARTLPLLQLLEAPENFA